MARSSPAENDQVASSKIQRLTFLLDTTQSGCEIIGGLLRLMVLYDENNDATLASMALRLRGDYLIAGDGAWVRCN